MNKSVFRTAGLVGVAVAMVAGASGVWAQSGGSSTIPTPASSADSGSRAVVAITVPTATDVQNIAIGAAQTVNQGTKPWTTHFAGQRKVISRGSIVNIRWADGAYAYRGGVQDVYLDFNTDGSIRVISSDGRLILNAPIPYGDNAVALGVAEGRPSPGITCRQYKDGDRAATVNVRFNVSPSALGTASGTPVGVNFGCP